MNWKYTLKNIMWQINIKGDLLVEVKRQIEDIYSNLGNVKPDFRKNGSGLTVYAGTPGNCREIQEAADKKLIDISSLLDDGHIIKTTVLNGKNCIIIAGLTDKAAAYGVFALFEETGCYFLASRSIYPETGVETKIPVIDKKFSTGNRWRGMFLSFCMVSTSILSISDFGDLFDQMFRMKMNRIVFYSFENEPVVDYTYKGERKIIGDISRPESGYFSYGRHFTGCFNVDEIRVGGEKYKRKIVAPMEFQDISSSDKALDAGKDYMNGIIREAGKRNIGVWISILPQFVSMNMSKYLKPMPRKNLHWSALVSCTDPVVREINTCRINNLVESYPGLEGIFIGIPEGFYEDPHKQSREYINETLPGFAEALELQKRFWGDHWPGDELQRRHMEADIAFSKVAVETINDARENIPGIKLGLLTVCKAYLLTKLDELLPGDITFLDIESRSLWTHGGAPLFLFKKMDKRECVIIPRITDDGSQAGMQFNLNLYHRDGYCRSTVKNTTDGLMMQTLHIKGADHNIKYLADGLWNPDIKPDDFYLGYLGKIYGENAVAGIKKAYDILEENEQFMGGRGAANMPWNHVPPEIMIIRSFRDFDNPYHVCPVSDEFLINSQKRASVYKKSISYLNEAACIFEAAFELCNTDGRKECRYMEIRTRAYACHLETLVMMSELYSAYGNAFEDKNQIRQKIHDVFNSAADAEKSALRSAGLFSACVGHTTDLAVLWMINSSMVKGTEILVQYLKNIKAFYDGNEYWDRIHWAELFGECPYPVHGIGHFSIKDESTEEPG